MARFDYGGICVLILGSSYPPIFYSFSCGPVLPGRNFFLFLITLTSSILFLMLMVPKMNQPQFRMFRALSFIFLGLSAGLPFVYIFFMKDKYQQYYLPTLSALPWLFGGIVYIVGALIYAFRIPEKYYPYRFDICGASHQIFHIAVIIGFTIMFIEAIRLYKVNKEFVCPIEVPKTF
jgi:adiponectin receptor